MPVMYLRRWKKVLIFVIAPRDFYHIPERAMVSDEQDPHY